MKISKLFHWLYGFLMCLPIFAVAFTCLYVTFNPNAKDSYVGGVSYLDSVKYSDYINNKPINPTTYTLNNTNYYIYSSTSFTNIELDVSNAYTTLADSGWIMFNCQEITWNNTLYENIKSVVIYNIGANKQMATYDVVINSDYFYSNGLHYLDIGTTITPISTTGQIYNSAMSFKAFLSNNAIYTNRLVSSNYNYFKNTYFDLYLNDNSLSSVFYSSVDVVKRSHLFGWASNSFLNTPITYLTNLFGMPSDSPIITYLSYWLNVSVIWLAFDLVMYVPLLAHRWIDKGIKE